jgi:hypothetical protein
VRGRVACRGSWGGYLSRRWPFGWGQTVVLEKGKLGLDCWWPTLGFRRCGPSLALLISGI